jgi:ribosomal protein S18 acetylase RimI-like enzyme
MKSPDTPKGDNMAIAAGSKKLKFRRGKLRDVMAMYSLDNRLFKPYAAYDLDAFQEFIFDSSFTVIVAESQGDLAAFTVLSIGRARSAMIVTIDVEPAYQGRGTGTRLMELAERLARRKGMAAMILQVSAVNEGAMRFYERLGYHRTRFTKGYYGGVEDGWDMKKEGEPERGAPQRWLLPPPEGGGVWPSPSPA